MMPGSVRKSTFVENGCNVVAAAVAVGRTWPPFCSSVAYYSLKFGCYFQYHNSSLQTVAREGSRGITEVHRRTVPLLYETTLLCC